MVFIRAKCGFFSSEVVFFRFWKRKKLKKKLKIFKIFDAIFFLTPVLQARYSQIWPNLGQIWVNFGQKGPFLKFPKKCENVIFFDSRDYASSKKLGKSDAWLTKKCEKPPFLVVLGTLRSNISISEQNQTKCWTD